MSLSVFKRIGHHMKPPKTTSDQSHGGHDHIHLPFDKNSFKRGKLAWGVKQPSSKPNLKDFQKSNISISIESPPLVCYGSWRESTGALLSGLIRLEGNGWKSFTMKLQSEILIKRPVNGNCVGCSVLINVINRWSFISVPATASRDAYTFPFSFLMPGNLPATTNNTLTKITYSLVATAIADQGDEINYRQPITLERAILPGPERACVRIFPPTNLSATLKIPSVVHPGGDFQFVIRLDGVVSSEKSKIWCQRRVNWRIEEKSSGISPACSDHSARLSGDLNGVFRQDIRMIGHGELKRGWKSNFDDPDSCIVTEVTGRIPIQSRAACDLETPEGINVEHFLVVEMIVAEEHRPTGNNRVVAPTGAARVLRMQFKMVVSSRSGLGISWDEEAPPMYEDVPASPPEYENGNPIFTIVDTPQIQDITVVPQITTI
jgi:hypothetical protein